MAGLSSRFVDAGYKKPKYMLPLGESSVFTRVLEGFQRYFENVKILFIYREIENCTSFIDEECQKLGLKNYQKIKLFHKTKGQAHTVMLGIQRAKIHPNESLLIFNIDTFRIDFSLPKEILKADGYLEVFSTKKGVQWSFIKGERGKVLQTAEKQRISNLCSSGLYYFKKCKDYKRVFKAAWHCGETIKGEFYIAPLYNRLIKEGKDIRYHRILLKEVVFCGIPKEYEKLKQSFKN